jgi:hypothetical protein
VVSASNFHWRGLHDSLTHKSNIQFCVSSRAMCGRWCSWVSFESLSFLFSATGRRSSISFRPYRRTPTGVVSQSLQRSRPHVCWLRDDSGEGAMAAEWRYRRVHPQKRAAGRFGCYFEGAGSLRVGRPLHHAVISTASMVSSFGPLTKRTTQFCRIKSQAWRRASSFEAKTRLTESLFDRRSK